MQLRILNAQDIVEILPMTTCIDVMRDAFAELQAGDADMPARSVITIPKQQAVSLFMPAYLSEKGSLGIKIVSSFPNNPRKNLPSIHGVVVLLDEKTGQIKALLDGAALTALRTGAVSGLATDLLARQDAETVAIIGSGVQAKTQLEAVCCVRAIKRVWIYSPTRKNVIRFAEELSYKKDIPEITIANYVHEATKYADIICTATPVTAPIVEFKDVKPGTHINAIGSHSAAMRELDEELISKAKVIVDQRAAALAEAGEIIHAIQNKLLSEKKLIELGQIIMNPTLGRNSSEQITLFKSVGLAIQDISAADYVLNAAIEKQRGTVIEF